MRLSSILALGLLLAILALALLGQYDSPAVTAARPFVVSGQVLNDGGPVEGARVRIQTEAGARQTDAQGLFSLLSERPDALVTAWKVGHFIAGARPEQGRIRLRLKPLPVEDNDDYAWVDSVPSPAERHSCGSCHGEIYREWRASGHSRSATGRHFLNLYDGTDWHGKADVGWGLLRQHPLGAGVCTSCHAPSVPSDDPALYDLRKVRGVSARGVHCDYCHKIADVADGTPGLTHGRFNLRLLRPKEGQLFFGPLDDVSRGEDAYSPLYHESRYCASCHEGIVFGVHVYSTYSEWLDSPARRQGKQCQDCHMRPTGRMTNIAPGHGGRERRPGTLANHRFFDRDQEAMLHRCLHVAAELPPHAADIRVWTEDVGHRVPTGFIDRHLIVVVEGRDAKGRALTPASGPALPSAAGPSLQGRSGRLYAKLLHDEQGHSPAPFWDADLDGADNRLRPGEPDRLHFTFCEEVVRLRVRVIYRRFWEEVARSKGWPDRDMVVKEESWTRE
jgi:hypothetical protein